MKSSLKWGLIALTYVGLFVAVHPDIVSGKKFVGWDAVFEHWGDLVYAYRTIIGGEFPWWNPYEKGGYPFFADPQSAVLYPINWICYGYMFLFGQGAGVVWFRTLIHIAIAAVGIHLYLKRRGLSDIAQWVGGISYILSSRLAKGKDSAGLWSAVWLPWLLLAAESLLSNPTKKRGVWFGVAVSLCFLSGYPPNFFRNLVAVAVVMIVTMLAQIRREAQRLLYVRRLLMSLGTAILVTGGLCLPNVLATAEFVPHTMRSALTVKEVMHSAMHIGNLANAIVPQVIAGGEIYVGVLSAFGFIGALIWAKRCTRSRDIYLSASLAALFFLFACGEQAGVLPVAIKVIPTLKMWRIPAQYLYVCHFFLSVVAAHGIHLLLTTSHRVRGRTAGLVTILSLVFITVALSAYVTRGKSDIALHAIGLSVATSVLVFCWVCVRSRYRRLLTVATVGLLVLDLSVQNRHVYAIAMDPPDLTREQQIVKRLAHHSDHRIAIDGITNYRLGSRHNIRELFGRNSTMILASYQRYRGAVAQVAPVAQRHAGLLKQSNVRFYDGVNWQLLATSGDANILTDRLIEIKDPAPIAFWTHCQPTPASRQQPHDGVYNDGMYHDATCTAWGSARGSVVAQIKTFRSNRLSLSIESPQNGGYLMINEVFYPGWRARVNHQPAPIHRANQLFRAVPVPQGQSTIELEYRPKKFQIALGIYVMTIALIGVWPSLRRQTF